MECNICNATFVKRRSGKGFAKRSMAGSLRMRAATGDEEVTVLEALQQLYNYEVLSNKNSIGSSAHFVK